MPDKDAHVKPCNCPEGYNELWRRALEADTGSLYVELMADHDRYAVAAGDAAVIGAY